jgi:ubiquinone/menaquinone biosynthesis C-methylase UbiE
METINNESLHLDETDEEVFQGYVEDLQLTPESFEKKILDIGAGSAQFAKWASEHEISKNIFSLEPFRENIPEGNKNIVGVAESLPFDDESFDLVVSKAAIPNIYLAEGSEEEILRKVTSSFHEMIRVLKPRGEIRLARVLFGNIYEPQIILSSIVQKVLQDLVKNNNIEIEKIRTPSDDTYEYNGHVKMGLLAEAYLIIIHKNV